jgi:putative membrane protein
MGWFALLASIHHLLAFGLVALLAAEIILLPLASDPAAYKRLGRIDLAYGLLAGLLLAAGLFRVFRGEASSDFYTDNPLFWLKLGVFVIVGLLSLPPTIRYIGWAKRMRADPAALPDKAEKAVMMAWLKAEAVLLALVPVLAAMMARGIGLP